MTRPPAGPVPNAARAPAASSAFALAGWLLLLGVFALSVYRAATQSITHDEALTYLWYIDGPISRAFGPYMPNNHVLHTLLAWVSVHALGLSELTLRLPSVLGGLLFLFGARAACRRAAGERWLGLLAFGLLALNPLVLDFLSAARGYGLALGFWLWALLAIMQWCDELAATGTLPTSPAPLLRASLLVGASAACHLTLALPGAALLGLAAASVLLQREPATAGAAGAASAARAGRKGPAIAALLLPGALLGAGLWLPSLLAAGPMKYVYGLPSLLDTSSDLVSISTAHHAMSWPLDTGGPLFRGLQYLLARAIVPLLLLGLALRLLFILRRAWRERSIAALTRAERFLLFTGLTLAASLAVFVAAHMLLGALYPQDRWGLSLILLCVLSITALAAEAWGRGRLRRAAAAPALAVLWCLLLQQASQLQAREYYVWSFDAGTRDAFAAIAARHTEHPDQPLRVAALHWTLVPALNFYRALHGAATWMNEVQPGWSESDAPFDCYLVRPGAHDAWAARHLRPIFTDAGTGVSVAVPK